jgi:RTX calcium-binding nonapeptide repeat (4 copies)
MRVHVVSDVQGNARALARAGDGADVLLGLGDLVDFVDYQHTPSAASSAACSAPGGRPAAGCRVGRSVPPGVSFDAPGLRPPWANASMTTTHRRSSMVLFGASLAFVGSLAFAPSALADPPPISGDPIPYVWPECFGRAYQLPVWFGDQQMTPGLPNVIYAEPGPGLTYGTTGDDVIVGTNEDDIIFGLGGDDRICALDGNDDVYGEEGVDDIDGGKGGDLLKGGADEDHLYGRLGHDEIWGDDTGGPYGNDYVEGGPNDDYILCVGGVDFAAGGAGTDGPLYGNGCETYADAE